MDNTLGVNMKKNFNNDLKFGIQANGIKHKHLDPMPDIATRFKMVKEQAIFDYVDKTPESHEVDDFKKYSQEYNLPIRGGGWFYEIGNHKELLEKNLKIGKELGSLVHNTQIKAYKSNVTILLFCKTIVCLDRLACRRSRGNVCCMVAYRCPF